MKLKYGPYSPSRLETGTCGYSFNKQYVDNKDFKKTEDLPQARGSAMHEVFEKITRAMIADKNHIFSPDEVRPWVVEAINRHPPAAAMKSVADEDSVESILDMARRYIDKPPAVLTPDAGVELRLAIKATGDNPLTFEECEYDDPDAFARGRADILLISDDTTTAIVYDHKTQPNIEEADTFQMGFYAWVIWKTHPFLERIQTILHFARYGKYSEPYTWTAQDLQKIEDQIMTRIAILESRTTWEPTPHKLCQYCPYLVECPAIAEFLEVDESTKAVRVAPRGLKILGDTGKAVKVAGLLNILEEVVKEAKSELRNHVSLGGAIAIPGKVYEFRDKEAIHWDKVNGGEMRQKVYAIFDKHGVDPKSFMSFNQTASAAIWIAENENLIKELSALFPRKAGTEFRGWKS